MWSLACCLLQRLLTLGFKDCHSIAFFWTRGLKKWRTKTKSSTWCSSTKISSREQLSRRHEALDPWTKETCKHWNSQFVRVTHSVTAAGQDVPHGLPVQVRRPRAWRSRENLAFLVHRLTPKGEGLSWAELSMPSSSQIYPLNVTLPPCRRNRMQKVWVQECAREPLLHGNPECRKLSPILWRSHDFVCFSPKPLL